MPIILFYTIGCSLVSHYSQFSSHYYNGVLKYGKNNFEEAIVCFNKAIEDEKSKENPNYEVLFSYYWVTGFSHFQLGELDKTLNYIEESFKYADNTKNKLAANFFKAKVYDDLGQSQLGLEYYRKALKYANELNDKKEIANVLRSAAERGYPYEESIKYVTAALEMDEQIDYKDGIIMDCLALARLYRENMNLNKSESYLNRAIALAGIDIFGKFSMEINENRALLAVANKQYDKAKSIFMAELAKYGEHERKAQRYYDYLGRLHYSFGNYELAKEYLEKPIAFSEKLRKSPIQDEKNVSYIAMKSIYEALISSNINLKNLTDAFNVSELITTRTLSEIVSNEPIGETPSLTSVQSYLKSNQAMIIFPCNSTSWLNFHKKVNAFVISNNDFYAYEDLLPDSINLTVLIKSYHNALSHRVWESSTIKNSKDIYSTLIKPIEHFLDGKDDLIFVTGGLYSLLPFETLMDESNQFLIENNSIRYVQSASIWKHLIEREHHNWEKELLAFGGAKYEINNSKMNSSIFSWDNLMFSEKEINIISRLFDSEIYSGTDVSEKHIKQIFNNNVISSYKMVHFATHGYIDFSYPKQSALVFSQGDEINDTEDGYFQVGEIADYSIKVDLVNLSACYTGFGNEIEGEGMFGLVWAFTAAGANSVNASLWSLQDKATSVYMESLYTKIQSGISYGEANTLTKREFISGKYGVKYVNPYYWGPFIYYGK